jgi:hypothetical protein
VFLGVSVAGSLVVEIANPGLLAARAKGIRKDTKSFDRVFYRQFLPLIVVSPPCDRNCPATKLTLGPPAIGFFPGFGDPSGDSVPWIAPVVVQLSRAGRACPGQ